MKEDFALLHYTTHYPKKQEIFGENTKKSEKNMKKVLDNGLYVWYNNMPLEKGSFKYARLRVSP